VTGCAASSLVQGVPAQVFGPLSPVGTVAGEAIDRINSRGHCAAWPGPAGKIRSPHRDKRIILRVQIKIHIPITGQDKAHRMAFPFVVYRFELQGISNDHPISII
jgi:hypothetical protein